MHDNLTSDYYEQNAAARLLVLFSICLGAFLTAATLSATLVAVPAISQDLSADAIYAAWIPASFILANLVSLLPSGRVADRHGRKKLYLAGLFLFLLATGLTGVAPTIEWLLAGRALQGFGAAMLFGPGLAIVGSVFSGQGRGAALGWVISSVYFGLTCGPLLGGWIIDALGWRYVFLLQLPPVVVALLLSLIFMKGEWRGENAERLDRVGALLFALGISLLFLGVTNLPELSALLLSLGACIVFALLLRQMRRSPWPLVRIDLVLRNRVLTQSLLASVFLYGGNFSLFFVMGLYLQYNRALDATQAGQMLMLQALVMALISPVSGRLSDRYQPRVLAAWGCGLVALGSALMLGLHQLESLAGIGAGLLVTGLGFGIFSTPNNNMALSSVPNAKLGIVSAMTNLARLVGQMTGTAVVTLLVAVFIGQTEITPEHYDGLLSVLEWMLAIAFFFAAFAAWSASRARPRPELDADPRS